MDDWNPSADFPKDEKVEGFDNNGEGLVMSGMQLGHYFLAAEEAVERATRFGPKPEFKTYSQQTPYYFGGKEYSDLPKLYHLGRYRFTPETPYTDLFGRHYRGGHIGFLPLARGGVPYSGYYKIRVRASAVGRTHDYGKALGSFRNGDPLVLEVAAVDREGSVISTGSVSVYRSIGTVDVMSETPQWFEFNAYLEKGFEPEVRFRNGPLAAKQMVRLLKSKEGSKEEFKEFADLPGLAKFHGILKAYRGPRLRIWEIQVEGPYVTEWPSRGHKLLYGDLRMNLPMKPFTNVCACLQTGPSAALPKLKNCGRYLQ